MKQTSWQLIYPKYEGVTKRALEFLNTELSKYLIRESGDYIIHVLPCILERAGIEIPENAVIVGAYGDSALVRRYVTEEEISECDYLVKAVENEASPDSSIIIVTAKEERNLYIAAGEFIDGYIYEHSPEHSTQRRVDLFFDNPIPHAKRCGKLYSKTRSIFAWGHALNDYRAYFRDMARQGLNQLILWNDYAPINARDIVECAHSYGIEMIWGFQWGWSEGSCKKYWDFSETALKKLKESVIEDYKNQWQGVGDGIYFQSFTEHGEDYIDGKLVAAVVTDFVNEVAEALYAINPDLKIQFGLHATSVMNHPEEIARVDGRIEILWEDCGSFPYEYSPNGRDEERYEKTLEFTKKIIELRGKKAKTGLVYKGFAVLDWARGKFVHQRGPFILGENAKEVSIHDRALRDTVFWRRYSAGWIKYGERARRMTELIINETDGEVNLCMAGAFDGEVWMPSAICSEIFKNPYRPFDDMVEELLQRKYIKVD